MFVKLLKVLLEKIIHLLRSLCLQRGTEAILLFTRNNTDVTGNTEVFC